MLVLHNFGCLINLDNNDNKYANTSVRIFNFTNFQKSISVLSSHVVAVVVCRIVLVLEIHAGPRSAIGRAPDS